SFGDVAKGEFPYLSYTMPKYLSVHFICIGLMALPPRGGPPSIPRLIPELLQSTCINQGRVVTLTDFTIPIAVPTFSFSTVSTINAIPTHHTTADETP